MHRASSVKRAEHSQVLDLFAEDGWRNVYAGNLPSRTARRTAALRGLLPPLPRDAAYFVDRAFVVCLGSTANAARRGRTRRERPRTTLTPPFMNGSQRGPIITLTDQIRAAASIRIQTNSAVATACPPARDPLSECRGQSGTVLFSADAWRVRHQRSASLKRVRRLPLSRTEPDRAPGECGTLHLGTHRGLRPRRTGQGHAGREGAAGCTPSSEVSARG